MKSVDLAWSDQRANLWRLLDMAADTKKGCPDGLEVAASNVSQAFGTLA